MSKLFYRLNSLIKYLKHNHLLAYSYETSTLKTDEDIVIIQEYKKLMKSFDNTNDMFKDVYISFIHVYEEELIIESKRDIAKNAKTKLLKEYRIINGEDSKPTDQYIYEHIELNDNLKPYLNLSTPYV